MLHVSHLAVEKSSCPLDGMILAMLFKPQSPLSPTVSGIHQGIIEANPAHVYKARCVATPQAHC